MSEDKARQLQAQIKTIQNLANSPETRELCTVVSAVIKELAKTDKPECGFTAKKTEAGDE